MDLQQSRNRIRELDEEMADLFVKRMEAVSDVAAYKRERGLPIEDREQEMRVIEGRSTLIENPELRSFYVQFLQHTMDVSKQWQHHLLEGQKIAYCGVEGAFAQTAARKIFPDAEAVPFSSFEDAYAAVSEGKCDAAVLPIENSYAGEVGQVQDLMLYGELYVNGIYDLSVTQNLLGLPGAALSDIRTVVSHPQALAQCESYIHTHGFQIKSAVNTAIAAQEAAAAGDISTAVIASGETAELYGLQVLDHDINEMRTNITRFAVFSRVENGPVSRKDGSTFLLLFTVKDEVGGLAKAVNIISAFDFNMRVLRSRPRKDLPWHYYFYVEAEGDDTSENGRRMLSALRGACPTVKVVGRFAV